jgi:hypothetical protein
MTEPLDGIRAIHNAFRKDLKTMDDAAYSAARGHTTSDVVTKRYSFFNEILVWHASGEESFVFTAMEGVAPLVAEAYERDHRGLDLLSDSLQKAVISADPLTIARATAAFNFHLSFHLNKEEAHLYRIFNEMIPLPAQGAIVSQMSQKIPKERFADAVNWLFPLLGSNDRENMIRIWQLALPPAAFAGALQLVKGVIGNDWLELVRRIPELK